MNKKYRLMICNCGRIHLISTEQINNSIYDNKDLMVICGGCGKVTILGADKDQNDYIDGRTYFLYTHELSKDRSKIIIADDFKGTKGQKAISKIIYDAGIQVPMMTGRYATSYCDGVFYDDLEPSLHELSKSDVTPDEVHEFITTYINNSQTVDMDKFIKESPTEVIEELSSYYIVGLNWDEDVLTKIHHHSR